MIISSNNNKVKKLVTFLTIFNFDQPYGIPYFFNTTHFVVSQNEIRQYDNTSS